jgi:hypothetical protein
MSVMPAVWETEIEGSQSETSLGQKHNTLFEKVKRNKVVTEVVEYLPGTSKFKSQYCQKII